MNPEISIRRAATIAEYRACQDAQRRAWGITEESYIVPLATMIGAQEHGSLVLGAFLPEGKAVGLAFAFLGRVEGRFCLYSQLTGVVPEFQGSGIGRRLKAEQRDFARSEGVSCLAWAFDPLQAGNAWFNLQILGATAGRYLENMYGPRSDALNLGRATDRLIAVWETSATIRADPPAIDLAKLPRLIAADPPTFHGPPDPAPEVVFLEIPSDFHELRAESPGRADAWESAIRNAFRAAFDAGYRASGFVRDRGYLLKRARMSRNDR